MLTYDSIVAKSWTWTCALTVKLVTGIQLIHHYVERVSDKPCRPFLQTVALAHCRHKWNFSIPFGKLYFLIIYLDNVVIIWRPLYLLLNSILYKVINRTRTSSKLFKVVARDLLSCVWVNMYVSNVATIIWSIKLPDSFQETSWNHFVIKLPQQTIDIYDIWPLSMIALVVIGHMPKIQLIPGHMQIMSLWQPTYFQQDYEEIFDHLTMINTLPPEIQMSGG